MKFAIALTTLTAAFAFANPVTAAVIIVGGVSLDSSPNPTHLANHIVDAAVANATTLSLPDQSNPINLIDFKANDGTVLGHSGNGGFAGVSALNGQGFSSLTIDPVTKAGFTSINFALAALGQGSNTYYADFFLDILGGGQVAFENVAVSTNGQNHFGISLAPNDSRVFSALTFSNLYTTQANTLAARFENIDQVSIELANAPGTPGQTAAVPEPSTWLMMLVGFGAIGFAMRRRQQVSARVNFA